MKAVRPRLVWAAVVSGLLCVGSGPLLAQQNCDARRYPMSSPSSRFEDHADGTVTDKVSQLMWMRCSLGQNWSGRSCDGSVGRFAWAAAGQGAAAVNRQGHYFYADWRLPQLRELATISERQCANPRLNLDIFPASPAAVYWTATSRSPGETAFAFAMSFGSEGVLYEDKNETHHVRLVRNAP